VGNPRIYRLNRDAPLVDTVGPR